MLGGCRLASTWWGVAALASAQLCRAGAGLEEYPRIPFGTRVMLVKDPKPKSAFVLQSEPATLLGPCKNISGSSWLFQHGKIRAKTSFQPQGLTDHDLNWAKTNLDNWDAPNAPQRAPAAHLYDAAALEEVVPGRWRCDQGYCHMSSMPVQEKEAETDVRSHTDLGGVSPCHSTTTCSSCTHASSPGRTGRG